MLHEGLARLRCGKIFLSDWHRNQLWRAGLFALRTWRLHKLMESRRSVHAPRRRSVLRNCWTSWDSQADLLGHSDGASISIIFAGSIRAVRGLILEAPHVFVEDLTIASIEQAKTAYETTIWRADWTLSRKRGCDILGMERHLARS